MSAATIVSHARTSWSVAAGSKNVALPASFQAGDLLVMIVLTQDGSNAPSGWSSDYDTGAGGWFNASIRHRTATASDVPGGTVAVTFKASTVGSVYTLAVRGSRPLSVAWTDLKLSTGGNVTSAPINTTTDDLLVYVNSSRTTSAPTISRGTLLDSSTPAGVTPQSILNTETPPATAGLTVSFTEASGSQGHFYGILQLGALYPNIVFKNATPTGVETLVASGSMAETLIAEMDTGPTLVAGSTYHVVIDLWEAMSAGPVTKGCIARLRDGGPTGTVLASHTYTDAGADSTAGHQQEWNAVYVVTPTTNRLCVTVQNTKAASQITSDTRTFEVRSPATPPPPSGPAVSWWDGTALQSGTLLGWWDGAAVQPAELLGWWDGSAIQPLQ